MTIWTTTPSAGNTALYTVPKVRVTTIKLSADGLLPNSRYTFWCNNVDMSWACRTLGSRQGAPLISDAYGSITVLFSCEMVSEIQQNVGGGSKYHNMALKDLNGSIKSLHLLKQTLVGK